MEEALRGAREGARAYVRASARGRAALGALAAARAGLGPGPGPAAGPGPAEGGRGGAAAPPPGPALAGALEGLRRGVRRAALEGRGRPAQRWRFEPGGGGDPGQAVVAALEGLLAAEEEVARALAALRACAARLAALALEPPPGGEVQEAGFEGVGGAGAGGCAPPEGAEAARDAALLSSLVVEMLERDEESLRAMVGDCCRGDALAAPLDTYASLWELQPFVDERILDRFMQHAL